MNNKKHMEQLATSIVETLRKNGHVAYFVGGCVRDMIMGVAAKDYDIATSARAETVMRLFKRTVPVGIQFGVVLVVMEGIEFQVATFRSDGAYIDGRHPQEVHFSGAAEDVRRRDFTINGLFFDPVDRAVIDYVSGEQDIRAGIIRAIGNPHERFREDKLRIMRALRFASTLGFSIEPDTLTAVKEYAGDIGQVSTERIREELVKMMTGPAPAQALRLMDQTGLLRIILPEIDAMKGVAQPPQYHPEGDVFTHTMLMMEKLQNASLVLAFAALLHDVGKPTTVDKETLKSPFHSEVGARMSEKILRRLRFSNETAEKIVWCVRNHMNFMHVQRMRLGKLKRLMATETFADELELHRIDCLSSHGMIDNYAFLRAKEKEFAAEDLKPKPFINGHDLIQRGMKPSPVFKEILDEAWTLQLEHAFASRDEALRWLEKQYGKSGGHA